MTPVHRLAFKVSETVVKYASPGCREWAEGLLQETVSIESDWSALCWALGSTRILLDRREKPIGSLAEASSMTWKFVEEQRVGTSQWMVHLTLALQELLGFIGAKTGFQRFCWSAAMLGTLLVLTHVFTERRRLKNLLHCNIEEENFVIYKAELERACRFPASAQGLFFYFGLFLSCCGIVLGEAPGFVSGLLLSILLPGVAVLVLHRHGMYRRRLERLEALLAERA